MADITIRSSTGEIVIRQDSTTLLVGTTGISEVFASNIRSGNASLGDALLADGAGAADWSALPVGDVTGPVSATIDAIATWADTGGAALLNTTVTVDGSGNVAIPSGGSITKPGTGTNSEAFGLNAVASALDATAIGNGASASAADATAIGRSTSAPGNRSVAVGNNASVNAGSSDSIAIGNFANVNGANGIAIGPGAAAKGNTVVIGDGATAESPSVAVGKDADAEVNSVAIGLGSVAVGTGGVHQGATVGHQSRAYQNSVSLGYRAGTGTAGSDANTAIESVAIGASSFLRTFDRTVSLGYGTNQNVDDAVVIGHAASSVATHTGAVAIGRSAATTAASRATIGTIGGSYDLELQVGLGAAFWGSTPPGSQPTVTGSRGGNAALASLLTALAATGLIVDGTS